MRALITVPWGERLGGAETMLWTLLRHLAGRRVDVSVIFFQPGPYVTEVEHLGVRTEVVEAGRLREPVKFAHTVLALVRVLRRERPHVMVNWAPKTHLYGGMAAALAGMSPRTLWWQHGIPEGGWVDRLATAVPGGAVGCSSQAAARAQSLLWPQRPTFVVQPGIDPPRERPAAELAALRARLRLPVEAFVLGVVGRLQPLKRQHVFLEALADLRRRGHSVKGLVVGGDAYGLSPSYARGLRELAARLAIEDHVHFTGQVEDARPYMELMDVLVSTSVSESFGVVLIEAMSLARPVVAFAAAGPAEILEDCRSGLLLGDAGPAALVTALERLLSDADLRRRLGEGAKQRFAERFTAVRMRERFERALNEMAGR